MTLVDHLVSEWIIQSIQQRSVDKWMNLRCNSATNPPVDNKDVIDRMNNQLTRPSSSPALPCRRQVWHRSTLQNLYLGFVSSQVRLWLLSGRYIGTCGDPWPDLIGPRRVNVALRRLPVDLRRCASPRTFRVTNTGSRGRLWQTAMALIKENLRRFRQVWNHLFPAILSVLPRFAWHR